MSPYAETTRCLLAVLAWHPNRIVSDEAIAHQIWGDNRPQHLRSSLYTCATRVRDAMQEAGVRAARTRLRRWHGGYLLETTPDAVDLHRFRESLRRAGQAARDGDDEAAHTLYDSCLATAGTTPMPGLYSDWAMRTRNALRQDVQSAQVGRAETALRLGRHIEYVPALYRLAEEHPLDERIAGLLMTALYRGGRQQEALHLYRMTRDRIVAEIGIEPTRELHELQGRMLRHDPALDPAEALQRPRT